jgi:Tfp pilus assembly protein PilX
MKRPFRSPLHNDNGSALLVALLILPMLTLFCVFAATIGNQDVMVTTNDKSHRVGLYNADASIYGTAKLLSLIYKTQGGTIAAGAGTEAPGITYSNTESDQADAFRHLITSTEGKNTTEDLQFTKIPGTDNGIESVVDVEKPNDRGGNVAGGGAEFGAGSEGVGTGINYVIFRIRAQGKTLLPNSAVQVNGDFWYIPTKGASTKGL